MATDATIVWSTDHWATTNKTDAMPVSPLNIWFVDLPPADSPDGSVIEFTFFWKEGHHWEGRSYSVAVSRLNT
jgi:hypothetical protein